MHTAVLVLVLLAGVALPGAVSAPASARIDSLPDFTGVPPSFAQYSGYITVNQTNGRNLFYWFVESENDPSSDPLVVWLQGGPGCSSLIGLMTENGPFRAVASADSLSGVALQRSAISWNRVANLLYIDAPAGVGYSYSDTHTDYATDNEKTAQDNYHFLQLWYKQFPEFATNPLWITGESYAGDYIPQLVAKILDEPHSSIADRLTGFLVGNPVLSCDGWKTRGNTIQIENYYWNGLISYSTYSLWMHSLCPGTTKNPPPECLDILAQVNKEVGSIDPDNMFTNQCTGNATLDITETVPNCRSFQDLRDAYLNRADVQAALHVTHPQTWVSCTTPAQLNYTTEWPNMLPYYKRFFEQKPSLRIAIYSGTADIATVPHAYTQTCIAELGDPITKRWHPFQIEGVDEVAGYVENHQHFTFVAFRGLGHEVPMFGPASAFYLFSHFLNDSFTV